MSDDAGDARCDLDGWQDVRTAITLAGKCHAAYLKAPPSVRRRFNRAVLSSPVFGRSCALAASRSFAKRDCHTPGGRDVTAGLRFDDVHVIHARPFEGARRVVLGVGTSHPTTCTP